MENQQQSNLLESIGGEPLEGSGFEAETSVLEDELTFGALSEQQEAEDQ